MPAFPPLTVFCPFIYILTHKDFGGSNISNDFIAINLNYFGAQIVSDLASGSPLKLEAWILPQIRWSGMMPFAYKTSLLWRENALRGPRRKQGDPVGGMCSPGESVAETRAVSQDRRKGWRSSRLAVQAAGLEGGVNVRAAREGGVGHEGRTVGKGLCNGFYSGV